MSVVNTNVKSLTAQASMQRVGRDLDTAMERLSTGKRINSAADDAAGLSIAERMTTQIRSLNMSIRNANDGISLVNTAEGAMQEVSDMLQRMRELAVQSVNGTYNADDRASLDAEVQQLKAEIDRIADTTKFNNQAILDGSFNGKMLQIGDSADANVRLDIESVKVSDLGMGGSGGAGNNVLIGRRTSFAAFAAGDVVINGQDLGAVASGDDMEDVVKNINDNVDNVVASGFNTVVARNAGTGVTSADDFQIKVMALGANTATTYKISASSSLEELRDNINAEAGGVVAASINEDGKLVLSNDTGATISVADGSATSSSSYDTGSGFYEGVTPSTFVSYAGFLRLESTDGSPITIERGNLALSSPGTDSDLRSLGFVEVTREGLGNDAYTVTGEALTSAGISTAWGQTDITINGVQIYDVDIDTTTFAGKLQAINNFSGETGVNASAVFEKSFTIDTANITDGGKAWVNGVELQWSATTVAAMVSEINHHKAEHGLVATANGNNIVLSGANVQLADIRYETLAETEYDVIHGVRSAYHSAASAGVAIALDFTDSAFFREGRTVTLSAAGGAWSVSYTVLNGDTATTVADELRAKIINEIDTVTAISYINATAGVISFQAAAKYGLESFTITLDDGEVFGTADVHYGRIRLDSTNETPIAILLGDSATSAEHGLLEMNVGAADFMVNGATIGTGGNSTIAGVNVTTISSAQKAITAIDNAITDINKSRSNLGALQNRLEHTVDNLTNVVLNTEASRSRILDTDYATETAELAKAQIIQQAATAMLAQANQQPQVVLALLQ